MWSLDSSIGAWEFATGFQIYYYCIQPHMGINELNPAPMANIPFNLVGTGRRMIELAVGK